MQILYRMIIKKSNCKAVVPPGFLSKTVEEAGFSLFSLKTPVFFVFFPCGIHPGRVYY